MKVKTKTRPLLAATLATYLAFCCSGLVSAQAMPRIVNGQPTQDSAASGALLLSTPTTSNTPYYQQICSGTLIGCQTFLTAAHCVCANGSAGGHSFSTCTLQAPDNLLIYLQNGGIYPVASVEMNPAYVFGGSGDNAVLTLKSPVVGIPPAHINITGTPALGTIGTIIGFGKTGGATSDSGIKREGRVALADCNSAISGVTQPGNICWQYSSTSTSDTCFGDSGGPMFVNLNGTDVVAGVTSGGTGSLCQSPDLSWDDDVYLSKGFIQGNIDPINDTLKINNTLKKCRNAVRTYARKYLEQIYTANRNCLDAVVAGKINRACPDATAQKSISSAAALLNSANIAQYCPAGILENSGLGGVCANAKTADDLKTCIMAAGDSAVTQMLNVEYADDTPSEPIADKVARKCQKAIANISNSYMLGNLNALNNCQSRKDNNKITDCPDATATNRIDKLNLITAKKFAKSCTNSAIATLMTGNSAGNPFGVGCVGANNVSDIGACQIAEHRNVANNLAALASGQAGVNPPPACGANTQVGDGNTFVLKLDNKSGVPVAMGYEHTFGLPPGFSVLRVSLNGIEDLSNDIDLYIKYGATPVPDPTYVHPNADAYSFNYGVFEAVEIANPQAGTWYALVVESGTSNPIPYYQLTITALKP
ncbi:trypsin-like serine protease [Methylomicrobium sp. Wu6]|uniref:trypsin-like serine protease n=1 Tax=Methylomicrobium sp. Wu6 TaxID=3107928 RepID=UPI002DD62575|nr:trypsin-like serine protease [Methylomicrobium sp. Wu6]MEC4750385.1 trypsin-like serine protease [Methylomicrobium sp. Wu6]